MKKSFNLIAATLLAVAGLNAYSTGPDARHTAAPGDDQLACASSACHVGTALNAGGGSVQIIFANGLSYVPGQSQTFTVMVTDTSARVYGFQLSARLSSNQANGQAGDFTAASGQIVICDDNNLKPAKGCAANVSVQFIEHSIPSRTGTWQVTWTPPATDVGPVDVYVAGNGANGDGNNTGDHIYTAHYILCPATGGKPCVTQAGVVSASAFNPKAGVASGTWLEIFGSDISTVTGGWGGGDFTGNNAPTTLNGVKVTIHGKPAYIDYTSDGQVNVQVPDDSATGPVQLIVSNAAGSSDPITVTKTATAPALLAPSSFNVGGKQYVVAQFADGTFVGKANLIAGVAFRPAKPGDTIVIYGIGFGPVTPTIVAGTIATQANSLVTKPSFLFGQTDATLSYYGLAPNFVGLYQFNVVVPNAGSGDIALNVSVGGVSTGQQLFITLQ